MAGLMSALHLAAYGKVVVATKGRLADCNTNFAQGGICCVMDPNDTFDKHARDTMIAGAWLGNSKVVHEIAKRLNVEMPICELVYAACYKDFDAKNAVKLMMERELKAE